MKLNSEKAKFNSTRKSLNDEKSRILIKNSKLIRDIRTKEKQRGEREQTILRLRKQVTSLKRKYQRTELSLREFKQNCIENSGLDVR